MTRKAMADLLADKLSGYTGSKFTVIRVDTPEGKRCALKAERGGIPYTFQSHRPMVLGEMTRWLASICDAVNMGFIPVQRK